MCRTTSALFFTAGRSPVLRSTASLNFPQRLRCHSLSSARRVLLLLPHMVMGGADQFNLDLIRNLPEDRYEFTIVTTLLEENDWQYRFADLTDDIFVLPHCADNGMWPAFCDYLVRTRSIDIIFNTNSYFSYYMLPWLHLRHPRIPVVDYIHMEEWYYRSGGYARPSARSRRCWMQRMCATRARGV